MMAGARVARRLRPLTGSLTVQVLAIVLATRAVLFGAAWLSLRALPRLGFYPAQLPDSFLPEEPLLDGWARWDTAHYVTIALHGYGGEGNLSHDGGLGFFPLYPMLMRWLLQLTGLDLTEGRLAAAAILIANVAFVVAVPMFARLVACQFGADIARTAALLLCISPFAYFFSAGYSESLFLLLIVLAFTCATRQWWLLAAVLAALATSSRLVALALPPALLLLAWKRHARLRDLIGIGVISPLGAVGYAAWTWWKFGDPLAYFTAQQSWGGWREHVWLYVELFALHPREALLGDPRHLIIVLNVTLGIIWLASLPWVWKMLDPGLALFTTLIVIFHTAMTWVSLGRYLLPAIGFYIVAAVLLHRPGWNTWVRESLIVCSAILLAMLTVLFAHGFWTI